MENRYLIHPDDLRRSERGIRIGGGRLEEVELVHYLIDILFEELGPIE